MNTDPAQIDVQTRAETRSSAPGLASRSHQQLWPALILFAAVFGVFASCLQHDFIDLDDYAYVTENAHVRQGLSWDNIVWAFGGTHVAFYHPLTLLSHCLVCQFFGLHPWAHHLLNVLLHSSNAVLLFLLLRRMTSTTWRSFFVAALFGLHPLRVESVAWVAERKDVLSTFFGFLTIWAYLNYVQFTKTQAKEPRPLVLLSSRSYLMALFSFACTLLSKPLLVTLPFLLLLLDYWPLHRISDGPTDMKSFFAKQTLRPLLFEKIPFFILAAADCVITLVAQKGAGALRMSAEVPFTTRLGNALISYCRYLGKVVWPQDLAVLYPYHQGAWPLWQVAFAALLLIGISLGTLLLLQKRPYIAIGWFWFIGMLFPAIGLIQAGVQAMADRWTYVPSIGLFILLTWAVNELLSPSRSQRICLGALGLTAVTASLVTTRLQLSYWTDTETLFRHTLAVTEKNVPMHNNLGVFLDERPGRLNEAIEQYKLALAIDPNDAATHSNLGASLAARPDGLPEAIAQFEAALRLDPQAEAAHYHLGRIFATDPRRLPDAINHYEAVLRIDPNNALTHNNLGELLERTPDRIPDAITHFETALRLNSQDPATHNNLAIALARTGRVSEALPHFQEALSLDPKDAQTHCNLGLTLLNLGRQHEAIVEYETALRLDPSLESARKTLEQLRASR